MTQSLPALQLVQNAAAWLALPIPQTVFGAMDPQTVQLASLLNEELIELAKWPDVYWQNLKREWNFTTLAADTQPTNALPPDFDHFIDGSMWDRTLTRPVVGPISPQIWEAWKARPVLTSVVFGFIIIQNLMQTAPNPPAGDSVYYQYISNLSVIPVGQTQPTQIYFQNDTDVCVFDSTLVQRGIRWRFLRAKGLDYAQEYETWISLLQREASRTGGMPRVSMAGSYNDWLVGPYIPSFNFPAPGV